MDLIPKPPKIKFKDCILVLTKDIEANIEIFQDTYCLLIINIT